MKNRNYIKLVIFSLLTMTIFSSCLKDKTYVDFPNVGASIDLPAVAFKGIFQSITLTASAGPTSYPVLVNVSVPNALTTPVNVVLKVDADALTNYNVKNNTSYVLMPAAAFTITNFTATVPANQTSGSITVNFNTSALPAGNNFVLPLTIVSSDAGTISQYKTILYNVSVK
ncbi:DUF1735 domain-containing protein [Pedobacter sp. NJ-S-72]